MNWILIIVLSDLGLAIGLATVFGLTRHIEGLVWLIVAVVCAVVIAKKTTQKRFLHGLLTGVIGGAAASLIQVVLFNLYLANNPEYSTSFAQMPGGMEPRLLLLMMTPVVAGSSGLFLGLLTWLVEKFLARQATPTGASQG